MMMVYDLLRLSTHVEEEGEVPLFMLMEGEVEERRTFQWIPIVLDDGESHTLIFLFFVVLTDIFPTLCCKCCCCVPRLLGECVYAHVPRTPSPSIFAIYARLSDALLFTLKQGHNVRSGILLLP